MGDDTEGVVPNKLWMGDVSDRLSAFSGGDLPLIVVCSGCMHDHHH